MSDNETQQIAQPIYYDDGEVIHACDSASGIPLVWTKCDMDMPDDQSFMIEGEGTGDYPSGVSGGDWLAAHAQRR